MKPRRSSGSGCRRGWHGVLTWAGLAGAAGLLLIAAHAWARVGGGHSFSGGGHYGGEGGHGGGGLLLYFILRLWLDWILLDPVVGLSVTAGVIVLFVVIRVVHGPLLPQNNAAVNWRAEAARLDSSARAPRPAAFQPPDPNFSLPLFLDFVRLLFVRVQECRGAADPAPVAPYVSAPVSGGLQRRTGVAAIHDVVVAGVTVDGVRQGASRTSIGVTIEAGYREDSSGGDVRPWHVVESWRLDRAPNVLSPGPDTLRALGCPACGSPVQLDTAGRCTACGQVVTNGRFGWCVGARRVVTEEVPGRGPVGHFRGGVEEGTDLPTVVQPNFAAARRAFMLRHPEFSWPHFDARVRETFFALNDAWSRRNWQAARPYETDALFDTHRYWIERYQRDGRTNHIDKAQVLQVVPCKVAPDAYFEALTVRLYAEMLDYTTDDSSGDIVDGSRHQPRTFSEYWTFIRRAGFSNDTHRAERTCPACGAPLKISMTGVCEYCQARVTGGDFDWVLSAIDQDEAYRG